VQVFLKFGNINVLVTSGPVANANAKKKQKTKKTVLCLSSSKIIAAGKFLFLPDTQTSHPTTG